MKRILFVDDDAGVLAGLQNLLRKQRRVWEMVFVPSGAAALTELAKGPFDVVVSDMRMPGMDGAELLDQVRLSYPSVARIILSGHAERAALLRSIPVAQQFLGKPCDGATLHSAIERACELRALLVDEGLRTIVGRVDSLVSAPDLYFELTSAIASDRATVATIAAIVERDPAMTAKMLHLVNCAFFGTARQVSSIHRAVEYLGIELLRGLVLTSHVFSSWEQRETGFSLDELQRASLITARITRRIVQRFPHSPELVDEAFAAAMVHDVGRLVLAMSNPEQFGQMHQLARDSGRSMRSVEYELLGTTHAHVGGYLLGIWGLPLTIIESVIHHHSPGTASPPPSIVLAALHVADALVDNLDSGQPEEIDTDFLAQAGLLEHLESWRALAHEEIEQMAAAA